MNISSRPISDEADKLQMLALSRQFPAVKKNVFVYRKDYAE
jgi:hypothetical protein